MYNPQNVLECEEAAKAKTRRTFIDSTMTVIGMIASVSSVPQIIKIIQTGDVSAISITTQALAFGAVVAWLLYGMYIKNKPLFITSSISTVVLGTVLLQLFIYH